MAMLRRSRLLMIACAVSMMLAAQAADAAVLVEFDAAAEGAGVEPDDVGWTLFGTPMINNGTFLLQDNTADDPTTQSGEYLSPSPGAGTMQRASGEYGIEFRVRPLTDIPHLGFSHFSNMKVQWSDDQSVFNVDMDLDEDDGGPLTTGAVDYGQNSLTPAMTGIDWSTPHTVFVGYRSAAEEFDFYLDGALMNTVAYGSIARLPGFPFAQDAVDFGDGTTGQGLDQAAEWYFIRIHDTAAPPGAGVLLGDANKDGQVTGADLISVQQNFGNVGATPLQGDANNDGQVTGADLISVQQNFGNVLGPAAPNVPEPATLALVGLAGLIMLHHRRGPS